MSAKPLVAEAPKGLLRFGLRLPIILYRLHLGWLLGGRFVLLNHIGRKSGQQRQTVVEVVGHDAVSDTYYIVSGWGYRAQWYQNLMATPEITIQVGSRRLDVTAATLSSDEGVKILLNYQQKHPLAAKELSRVLGINLAEGSAVELQAAIEKSLPVVALVSRSGSRTTPVS